MLENFTISLICSQEATVDILATNMVLLSLFYVKLGLLRLPDIGMRLEEQHGGVILTLEYDTVEFFPSLKLQNAKTHEACLCCATTDIDTIIQPR